MNRNVNAVLLILGGEFIVILGDAIDSVPFKMFPTESVRVVFTGELNTT